MRAKSKAPRKPENPADRAMAQAGRKIDNARKRIAAAKQEFEAKIAADQKVIDTQTAVLEALKRGAQAGAN